VPLHRGRAAGEFRGPTVKLVRGVGAAALGPLRHLEMRSLHGTVDLALVRVCLDRYRRGSLVREITVQSSARDSAVAPSVAGVIQNSRADPSCRAVGRAFTAAGSAASYESRSSCPKTKPRRRTVSKQGGDEWLLDQLPDAGKGRQCQRTDRRRPASDCRGLLRFEIDEIPKLICRESRM